MPQTAVRTGVRLNYEIRGEGHPLLLVMGTSGSLLLWTDAVPGARFELLTGPGSSHGVHIERPEDVVAW
ncbi:hypothetical protein [Blastococcus sp. SYSU DS0619]